VVDDAASWLRSNIGLAAGVLAIVGALAGAAIAAASWLASVHHLERRVDILRHEIDVMRTTMDRNRVLVADVRRGLEATDATVKEAVARLEERIKAGERRP
jgi:uncharacterized membrane protein YhiD involved in acid resistance